jgi:hypothetical protein
VKSTKQFGILTMSSDITLQSTLHSIPSQIIFTVIFSLVFMRSTSINSLFSLSTFILDKISDTITQPTFFAKINSCNLPDDKNSTKIFSSNSTASFWLTTFYLGVLPLFFREGPSTETVDKTLPFGPPLFMC